MESNKPLKFILSVGVLLSSSVWAESNPAYKETENPAPSNTANDNIWAHDHLGSTPSPRPGTDSRGTSYEQDISPTPAPKPTKTIPAERIYW